MQTVIVDPKDFKMTMLQYLISGVVNDHGFEDTVISRITYIYIYSFSKHFMVLYTLKALSTTQSNVCWSSKCSC